MISEENFTIIFEFIKNQIENSLLFVVELSISDEIFNDSDCVKALFVSIGEFIDSFCSTMSSLSLNEDVLIKVKNIAFLIDL